MPSLFVSHSSRDNTAVAWLSKRLDAQGIASLFVDFDPEKGIPVGRKWEAVLYAQLRHADGVLFVGSEASVASKWYFAELVMARSLGKVIVPVSIVEGVRHPLLDDVQAIELRIDPGADSSSLDSLVSRLRLKDLDLERAFDWDPARVPFPGLEPFQECDVAVFFGRDSEIRDLLSRLRSSTQRYSGHLVAVVGPSGAGKSSFVRAGVLPRLKQQRQPWVVVPSVIHPGPAPIRQLTLALSKSFLGYRDLQNVEDAVSTGPAALVGLVNELCSIAEVTPSNDCVLFIDQAEEILVPSSTAEAERFLKLLRDATRASSRLWVIIATRSEYLDALLRAAPMAELFDHQVLLAPLDRSRLPSVIEGPAARVGLTFEEGLVARVMEDTHGGDAVPMLAYTLSQLYPLAKTQGKFTHEQYSNVGGVVGALRDRADELHARLGDAVIPTLLNLAHLDREGEVTGRQVHRDLFSNAENAILEGFIEARLIISAESEGKAIVGVAHEALLRRWPPLAQAIANHRSELQMRAELGTLAKEWDRAGRRDSYLLRDERLQAVRLWHQHHVAELESIPLATIYLEHSLRLDKMSRRQAVDLLAERVRAGFPDAPELGVQVMVAGIEAYGSTPHAISALEVALAAMRTVMVLRDHEASVGQIAWSSDDLRIATTSDRTIRIWDPVRGEMLLKLRDDDGAIWRVCWARKGERLISQTWAETVSIWNALTGDLLLKLGPDDTGKRLSQFAEWSYDGCLLATSHHGGGVDIRSATDLQVLFSFGQLEGLVCNAKWSPDDLRIATVSQDGTVSIWDVKTLNLMHKLTLLHEASQVAWSPAGDRLAVSSQGGAEIWDANINKLLLELRGHEHIPHQVGWSPDGKWLVSVDWRHVCVWDGIHGQLIREVQSTEKSFHELVGRSRWRDFRPMTKSEWQANEDSLGKVAWSPDSKRLVTTSSNGIARVWDIAKNKVLFELRSHNAGLRDVEWSAGGLFIATASNDKTARIWDAVDIRQPIELWEWGRGQAMRAVAWSPDGGRLATASTSASIWDIRTREVLLAMPGNEAFGVWHIAWSPDGSRLATATQDGVQIWNVTGDERLQSRERKVDKPLLNLSSVRGARGVAWSPNGRFLATVSDSNGFIIDSLTGEQLVSLRGTKAVTWAPEGNRVATASDNNAQIWNATNAEMLLELCGHKGWVAGLAWSPDGEFLATASWDHSVYVWDTSTGHRLQELLGHSAPVLGIAWSCDGRLATGSKDYSVRVWDPRSEELLRELRGHEDTVEGVAWSPDGKWLATASYDGTVRIWNVPPLSQLLATVRQLISRELTAQERLRFGLPT